MDSRISYAELITDFNKTMQTDISTLLVQEKERYEGEMRST